MSLSFYQLRDACRIGSAAQFFSRVDAWSKKRQALAVQLNASVDGQNRPRMDA